ncbi:hypothetical protein [Pseudoruegeria sp. SHC-113]|uniref:hypothetical protein n=1 Tax=Pseudoruegeria sp. SHC-113 TaxID=2855439 RepID=UPI0021BAF8FE|nr:hypothetical protein [Pseudoruegeria sp. SHC-113]MCT8160289.1 hypothetical protein [Pseudoruegeria sp. SHC-113]
MKIRIALATTCLLAACGGPTTTLTVPSSQGAATMFAGQSAVQNAPAQPARYVAPNVAAAQPNLGPAGADLLLP